MDLTRELLKRCYSAPTAAFRLVIRRAILLTRGGKNVLMTLLCAVVGRLANVLDLALSWLKQRPVSRPIWNPGNFRLPVSVTCLLGATLIRRIGGPFCWVRLPDSMLWKVFPLLGATLALGRLVLRVRLAATVFLLLPALRCCPLYCYA